MDNKAERQSELSGRETNTVIGIEERFLFFLAKAHDCVAIFIEKKLPLSS